MRRFASLDKGWREAGRRRERVQTDKFRLGWKMTVLKEKEVESYLYLRAIKLLGRYVGGHSLTTFTIRDRCGSNLPNLEKNVNQVVKIPQKNRST